MFLHYDLEEEKGGARLTTYALFLKFEYFIFPGERANNEICIFARAILPREYFNCI